MSVGSRIRDQRIALGMSVDDLAARIGKSRATMYRYENDDIENIPVAVIGPIAEALHVSPAYLMGWAEKEEPSKDPTLEDMLLRLGATPDQAREISRSFSQDGRLTPEEVTRLLDIIRIVRR